MSKFIAMFFVVLFVFACNQEVKKNHITIDTNKLRAEENKYLQKMESKKNKQYNYLNNLTPEELISFLPNEIEGYEKLPNSMGTQSNDDGKLYTFVKGQYQSQSRQTIVIDIFDYGKGNEIPDKAIYTNPPKDLDSPATKYKDDFSEGFIILDKKLDYGRAEVLIHDRFVVVVRLNRNIQNDKQLIHILKLVKLEKLNKID
ncbi:MAG TPA: hypothetical protein PLE30_04100 [Candidatus Kapabacteria bacterium]|nr:hypothetical protein [Candidatus Kapabacteria bacterium]